MVYVVVLSPLALLYFFIASTLPNYSSLRLVCINQISSSIFLRDSTVCSLLAIFLYSTNCWHPHYYRPTAWVNQFQLAGPERYGVNHGPSYWFVKLWIPNFSIFHPGWSFVLFLPSVNIYVYFSYNKHGQTPPPPSWSPSRTAIDPAPPPAWLVSLPPLLLSLGIWGLGPFPFPANRQTVRQTYKDIFFVWSKISQHR